jgi:hypothetical protein
MDYKLRILLTCWKRVYQYNTGLWLKVLDGRDRVEFCLSVDYEALNSVGELKLNLIRRVVQSTCYGRVTIMGRPAGVVWQEILKY